MDRLKSRLTAMDFQQWVVYVGFLAIFLFFALTLHDDGFLTQRNLTNIILQTAPATIMAVGLVFALSAGEIDLSFGSIVAVSSLSAAVAMQSYPLAVGVAAGLGAGILIGAFNGILVAYFKLPSFLVTLATCRASTTLSGSDNHFGRFMSRCGVA
jgi:ribose transport system permease protein